MRVKRIGDGIKVWFSAKDTYNWARYPGREWPCSTLSNHRVFAEFEANGDLVDFAIDGKSGDCDAHELNAMVSDLVVVPLPAVIDI